MTSVGIAAVTKSAYRRFIYNEYHQVQQFQIYQYPIWIEI